MEGRTGKSERVRVELPKGLSDGGDEYLVMRGTLEVVETELQAITQRHKEGGVYVDRNQGVYGYGKEVLKVAMLTAISWRNGGQGWKTGMGEVKGAMRDLFEDGKFIYDKVLGGVITKDGVLDDGKVRL